MRADALPQVIAERLRDISTINYRRKFRLKSQQVDNKIIETELQDSNKTYIN